jgi:putative membrane protein
VQQPLVASFLFVALIFLWLIPAVHFYAMLSWPLYKLMNWSMALDGLLFWWMIFNAHPRTLRPPRFYGMRIGLLFAITLPQIALGAYIALCGKPLYPIYAVCGRIWPLSPATDQQLGGLITWIPASMMSLFGMLAVLHQWFKSERQRNERAGREKNVLQTA